MGNESKPNVKLGVVGLGGRGRGLLGLLQKMDDVEIVAVSDNHDDRMGMAVDQAQKAGKSEPACYKNYKDLLAREDIAGVLVTSSWTSHAEVAVAAMKAGKRVASEVGGAASIEECWQLVRTSEETGIPCMLLENCCYGREEMAVLHMVRQGLFGELIHCQGAYEHDLRNEVAMGVEHRHYRIHNYLNRNGDVYPTHGLGPWAKCLDINRGNRFVSLTSMASKSRGIPLWAADNLEEGHPAAKADFALGDIVTTMIKCAHGETILLTHDTSLPRPYSRGGRVQGTKGIWMEDNNSIHIEGESPQHEWESFDGYKEKHDHPVWKWYQEAGVRGGHGGMDYLVLRGYIDSIADGTEPPIDVYDMAAWMAVTTLSEQSIALGSAPVSFPDFTNGKWIDRPKRTEGFYSL